jgi:hypothetical protein
VSSVGIGRSKDLPLVHSHDHLCLFRHALALDEHRVKFLPEYVHGGESSARGSVSQRHMNDGHADGPGRTPEMDLREDNTHDVKVEGKDEAMALPHVKEVWFAGSHSDVCVV